MKNVDINIYFNGDAYIFGKFFIQNLGSLFTRNFIPIFVLEKKGKVILNYKMAIRHVFYKFSILLFSIVQKLGFFFGVVKLREVPKLRK